jgi:hypothetical protein
VKVDPIRSITKSSEVDMNHIWIRIVHMNWLKISSTKHGRRFGHRVLSKLWCAGRV